MAIVLLVIFYAGLDVALGMLVFLFLLLFRMKEWSKLCVCVCVCVCVIFVETAMYFVSF